MKRVNDIPKYFLYCWVFFLVPAAVYLLLYTKGELSLQLNAHHNSGADSFFRFSTYGGDGVTVVAICMVLFFIKYKYAIIASLNSLIVSLITAILKNIFNTDRPSIYFPTETELHFVQGIHIYKAYSFPSGHTAAAFGLFFTLAFFTRKPMIQILFCLIAVTVAFSRVYLLQHFLIDVWVGSVLAVVTVQLLMIFYTRKTKWLQTGILESSLLTKRKALI